MTPDGLTTFEPEVEAFLAYDHYQRYEALAQKLGLAKLRSCVFRALGLCCHADPIEFLQERCKQDEYLNNIELRKWESQEPVVRGMMRKAGVRTLSSLESVCVLKHVAVHHILQLPSPPAVVDPRR